MHIAIISALEIKVGYKLPSMDGWRIYVNKNTKVKYIVHVINDD
jgi:hypothetical protein